LKSLSGHWQAQQEWFESFYLQDLNLSGGRRREKEGREGEGRGGEGRGGEERRGEGEWF
jgi:hypothetical protein